MKTISFKPKKSLAQNFLINQHIQQKILQTCELTKEDIVVEIGPGLGALTQGILPHVKKLYAIERDPRCCQQLETNLGSYSNFVLIQDDFLMIDLSRIQQKPLKIIGNLPFNISTPILGKLIENRFLINNIFITVQHEFGKRICSGPDTKQYGRLTLFIQYFCEAKLHFKIKNSAFNPIPKVDSCFMALKMRKVPMVNVTREDIFFEIIKAGFQQRRKTLLNALTKKFSKKFLLEKYRLLNFEPWIRAENLTIQNYAHLANALLEN